MDGQGASGHDFTGVRTTHAWLTALRAGGHRVAASIEEYLANEETEHKRELEKRYYEIIHSGGV